MSTRDTDQDDDARFAALLRKDDELSQLLRALDQPEPSAALDAAILRDAEIALQDTNTNTAANDPAFPNGTRRSSFLTRWKLPLSMAAAALLSLSLIWKQYGSSSTDAPLQVAQAPMEPAATAGTSIAASTTPIAPPVATAPTAKQADMQLAQASAAGESKDAALAMREKAADQAARESARVATARSETTQHEKEKKAAMHAEQAARADIIAKADIPDAASYSTRGIAPSMPAPLPSPNTPSAETQAAAAPAQVAPTISPRALARSQPDNAAKPYAPAASVAGAAADAADIVGAAKPIAAPLPARDWLKKIEEKIDAGSQREAWEEWEKFHKTYPTYDVPKTLLEKIARLKK